MKATTAGAAVKGGTYLNTKGAKVEIAEDQTKVAPGFVRVIVAGQAFTVPDSLPLYEPDATAAALKRDVADLVGKPEAAIREALADLTDEQLDARLRQLASLIEIGVAGPSGREEAPQGSATAH